MSPKKYSTPVVEPEPISASWVWFCGLTMVVMTALPST